MRRRTGLAFLAALVSWPLWMVITTTFFSFDSRGQIGATDFVAGLMLALLAVLAAVIAGRLLAPTRLWVHWNARAIWAVILAGAGAISFLQTFLPLLGADRPANVFEGAAYSLAGFALTFAVANWPGTTSIRGRHAV